MRRNRAAILLPALLALAACAGPAATLAETRTDGSQVYQRGEERYVVHPTTEQDRRALESAVPLPAGPVTIDVNGLGCPLCATNIDKQLLRLPGVSGARVDLGQGSVTLTLAGGKTPSPRDLREAVEDAGFTLARLHPAK
jgi:copper chaperone CopZ